MKITADLLGKKNVFKLQQSNQSNVLNKSYYQWECDIQKNKYSKMIGEKHFIVNQIERIHRIQICIPKNAKEITQDEGK